MGNCIGIGELDVVSPGELAKQVSKWTRHCIVMP
jgi:hypothetical protein